MADGVTVVVNGGHRRFVAGLAFMYMYAHRSTYPADGLCREECGDDTHKDVSHPVLQE